MSAADKVSFVDTVYGADLYADGTARAKLVVDSSKVVFDLDSSVGAGLFALHTTDASVFALLACDSALFVVGAFHNHSGGVVYYLDNIIGTLTRAYTASDTFSGVNSRNAVFNADSVLGADLDAVTVSEAGKVTCLVTAVKKVCGMAALGAASVVFSFYRVAGAVAGNVSNLFHNVLRLNTDESGDLGGCFVTSGNTEVGGGG